MWSIYLIRICMTERGIFKTLNLFLKINYYNSGETQWKDTPSMFTMKCMLFFLKCLLKALLIVVVVYIISNKIFMYIYLYSVCWE